MSILNRDVLSGALFVAAGAGGLWFGQELAIGTAFRMGPGYFPRLLCSLLVVIGAIVAVKGIIAGGDRPDGLHWRPLILVTIAVLLFAGLVGNFGLLPAAAAVVFVGALGGPEFKIVEGVALAAILSAASVALFIYALGMTMPIFKI